MANFDANGNLLSSLGSTVALMQPARSADGFLASFMNLYDLDARTTLVGFGCLAGQVKETSATNPRAVRMADVFKVVNLASSAAEQTIWTPASGKKFRALGLVLGTGAAATLTLRDNLAGTTIFLVPCGGTAPTVVDLDGWGLLSAAANNVLTVQASVATTIVGTVYGVEE